MNPTIRKATSNDVPALLALLRACVDGMLAVGIEQWDDLYPSAEVMGHDVEQGTLWVLQCEHDLAACITIDRNMDPLWANLDWKAEFATAAAVHRLMVHPAMQGRGCARLMMAHAESVSRELGCDSIRLDSFSQNPVAMALYPRLGYRFTGTAVMRKGVFAGFEKRLNARNFRIEAMTPEDILAAVELWRGTEGIGVTPDETPEMLCAYLERNARISSVAKTDSGELIGALLGGHDGRRSFMYHLAVKEGYRGSGVGRALVQRTSGELGRLGMPKANIMVYHTNDEGRAFWEHLGWVHRSDLLPMQITL